MPEHQQQSQNLSPHLSGSKACLCFLLCSTQPTSNLQTSEAITITNQLSTQMYVYIYAASFVSTIKCRNKFLKQSQLCVCTGREKQGRHSSLKIFSQLLMERQECDRVAENQNVSSSQHFGPFLKSTRKQHDFGITTRQAGHGNKKCINSSVSWSTAAVGLQISFAASIESLRFPEV